MAPIFTRNRFRRYTVDSSPLEAASKEPHDQQEHDRANGGINDLRYEAYADMDSKPRKQQAGNQRAGDTDKNVADNPKAGAPTTFPASQPAIRPTNKMTRIPSLDICIRTFPLLVRAIPARRGRTYP
jgi:hypothetical protein